LKNIGILLLLLIPSLAFSQERINIGNFNFFLSPKIMEDGSIIDVGFGLYYNDSWGGEIKLRYTSTEKNEEISGTEDSLNAIKEKMFEIFFLPAEYRLIDKSNFRFWAGIGLYYEYDNLYEKGFFNLPVLETLDPPRERVNSYNNDFRMHIFGPLIETGISYLSPHFSVNLSCGLVPVFFMSADQKMSIVPLLDPTIADFSQTTWGSPHFFINFENTIFKYVNLMLIYDAAWLNYQVVDFDENLKWIHPDRNVVTHSLQTEISFLYPFSYEMSFQLGYGYMINFVSLDSAPAVSNNKHYIILSTKKRIK